MVPNTEFFYDPKKLAKILKVWIRLALAEFYLTIAHAMCGRLKIEYTAYF